MITRDGKLEATHGTERRHAVFSACEKYRYYLEIEFAPSLLLDPAKDVAFLLMNPSTATEIVDDPTIRRCKAYTRDWGLGSLVILNAYGYRSTDPKGLRETSDPNGPGNDDMIRRTVSNVDMVVLGWGANVIPASRREEIFEILAPYREKVHALAVTKDGSPGHPLYLRADLKPQPYLFETSMATTGGDVTRGGVSPNR